MIMTNNEIYNHAANLATFYLEERMPVRINFFLQKNILIIQNLAKEIDAERLTIAQAFGEINADGTAYNIPPEKMAEAQKELNDLFALEQDVQIHKFDLEDFADIELTMQQLSAIMFMIEE